MAAVISISSRDNLINGMAGFVGRVRTDSITGNCHGIIIGLLSVVRYAVMGMLTAGSVPECQHENDAFMEVT